MHRFIHYGVIFIALGCCVIVPAVAEQISSDKSLSSPSLDGHRLFFSVQERKQIQPTATTSKTLEVEQPSSESRIERQKKLPVQAISTSTPGEDKKTVHYQALLESESVFRLIINGMPCDVVAALSLQSSVDRIAVDCQSTTLSSVNLTWVPASRMLEVERPDGAVSLLALGGSL